MVDLSQIPSSPGVYIYKDKQKDIIYVGKAINLRRRVSQYFQRDDALGAKTKTLVAQIDSIETKIVNSEIEALVLEASLIKKHKPKYNSLLRDDKSYIFIVISNHNLPYIYTAHISNLPKKGQYYGPFPSAMSVKSLLKTLRRIFPYYSKPHGPKTCLYCHLGLCPGPNPDPQKYRHNILKIKKVLNGRFTLLRRQLKKEMDLSSNNQDFETALESRNQLQSLDYIVSGWSNLKLMFDHIELPQDRQSSALNELQTTLQPYFPQMKKINRIECYDISQMGNRYFVGAMTVSENANLAKNEYRKFKIYSKIDLPDDQFMIKEVVWRRLRHPEWSLPDLIVVDGGKPQVSAADSVAGSLPLVGLAKKFETIVLKTPDGWQEINLPPNSTALMLLQLLRDEAHRFANAYRRQLMKNALFNSKHPSKELHSD